MKKNDMFSTSISLCAREGAGLVAVLFKAQKLFWPLVSIFGKIEFAILCEFRCFSKCGMGKYFMP